jgi:translation initiation factor IF-2
MAQMNVEQFAQELKLDPSRLIEQLQAAGVNKKLAEDLLTEQDRTQLLEYLHRVHGAKDQKKKITLTLRQTSEIKKSDNTGKARTIQIEVRKKRVFVKRDGSAAEDEGHETAPMLDAEQVALRE